MPAHGSVTGIERSLVAESRYLLILCSPGARDSNDVDKEIRSWAERSIKRRKRCLLACTEGVLAAATELDEAQSTALSRAAASLFTETPLWRARAFRRQFRRYRLCCSAATLPARARKARGSHLAHPPTASWMPMRRPFDARLIASVAVAALLRCLCVSGSGPAPAATQ